MTLRAGSGPARAALPRVQRARRRRALPLRHDAAARALRGVLRARFLRRARRRARGHARHRPRLRLRTRLSHTPTYFYEAVYLLMLRGVTCTCLG